jgi:N-terminal acetyltransferase B complex catalytic subunit
LYTGMGYSIYRRVVDYYNDDPTDPTKDGEDAYDMRKPLKRDKDLKHIRKNGENFAVNPEDVW